MTTTIEVILTEDEVLDLERKAYEYYDERVKFVKDSRKANGISEELTEDDILLLQHQTAVRLEKLTREYKTQKRALEGRLKAMHYMQAIKAPERVENYTSAQYWEMIIPTLNYYVDKKKPGRTFQFKEGLEFMLKMMCHYWACDDRFYWYANQRMDDKPVIVQGKPHLDKGLGFFGLNGVGKSLFQEAFQHNPRLSYSFINSKDLPKLFEEDGYVGISKYYRIIKGIERTHYGQSQIGLAIDDIYGEGIGSYYKTSCETVETVMYQRWECLPGYFTHFTTNHKLFELEKRYGTRFLDRMVGSANLIRFPKLPSFRD